MTTNQDGPMPKRDPGMHRRSLANRTFSFPSANGRLFCGAPLLHETQTVSHTHMQQARKFSQTASTSPPIAPHPSSPRPGDRYNLQNTLA